MTSPVSFISETVSELKKVVWPTKEELFRLTVIVLLISVVVGIYIGVIDFTLSKITEILIK